MYILSLDTTAKTASVCVCSFDGTDLRPVSSFSVNGTLTHSESLLPAIDFCLKSANLRFSHTEAAVISAGPGSFTGVRIGIATLKGLAFGAENYPCIGVSTLASLALNARSYPVGSVVFPVMDARRSQFYNAAFRVLPGGKVKRLCEDRLETFEVLAGDISENYHSKKIILTGDGAELFYSLWKKSGADKPEVALCRYEDMYQDAFSAALAAKDILESGGYKDKEKYGYDKISPVYLRASQAERERNEKQTGRGKQN